MSVVGEGEGECEGESEGEVGGEGCRVVRSALPVGAE